MPQTLACSLCGSLIPVALAGGQCPSCLLKLALGNTPREGDTDASLDAATPTREYAGPSDQTSERRPDNPDATATAIDLQPTLPGAPDVSGQSVRFGNYELREELGRGGMGVVFRAVQAVARREVAVKVLLGGAAGGAVHGGRFVAEVSALGNLRHPNIVTVYEVGEVGGAAFFSMEYVANGTLSRRLKGGLLPAREAAELIGKLAGAVEAAHRLGVLHRDIKPGNVLLGENGEPKLSDFGLAKWVDRDDRLTAAGAVMGTPSYMSPEQARDAKTVGPTADVYSLGATLYECLTGRPPFRGSDSYSIIRQVLTKEPKPPRSVRKDVPPELEAICLKCLEKDPARRYATAQELTDDLARWRAGESTTARPLNGWQRTWLRVLRNWKPIAAVLLLLMAVGIALAMVPPRRETPAEQIEAALKRGEVVTLIEATGGPKYQRWTVGIGEVNGDVPHQSFLVKCAQTGLLELAPDSLHERFRLSVEFQHDESLTSKSAAGLYFGHKVSESTPAGVGERAIVLQFMDDLINNKPLFRTGDAVTLSDSLFVRSELFPFAETGPSLRTHWVQEEKHPGVTRPWRKISVEVTPDAVRAFWRQNPDGPMQLLDNRKVPTDSMRSAMEQTHRPRIKQDFPGINAAGLDYTPRGGIGLYVRNAQVYFRNVVLEPMAP